jgi:hypothetical protein
MNSLLTFLKIILICLLIPILLGCKKEIGEYLLGDLKRQNPYDGTETLLFISNSNDTIKFYGNGRYSKLFRSYSDDNSGNYYINESDECRFRSDDEDYELFIHISTHKASGFQMGIEFIESYNPEQVTCEFRSVYHAQFSNYENNNEYFLDSLFVNNQFYFDVFSDSSLLVSSTPSHSNCYGLRPSVISYNITYGILKFDFDDGSAWELKEIIP